MKRDAEPLLLLALLLLVTGGLGGGDHKDEDADAAREAVLDDFERYGWPRKEAAFAINMESGWNPHARGRPDKHGARAVGLVQFRPFALRAIGYHGTPESFAQLSIAEQRPWIERFLIGLKAWGKRYTLPGDTYIALAGPKWVGAPEGVVMYPAGSDAARGNPTLQDEHGNVTTTSVRRALLSAMGQSTVNVMPPELEKS